MYEFFLHRYKLFKNIYSNQKSSGYDYLIKDLFLEASTEYNFKEIIFDPEQYLDLNNSIYFQIKNIKRPKIQEIIKRFHTRDHYRVVGEPISKNLIKKKKLSQDQIDKLLGLVIGCQQGDGSGDELTVENCFLYTSYFRFIDENQFDNIMVFDRFDPNRDPRPLSEYNYGIDRNFCVEFRLFFMVKEKRLISRAVKAWSRFVSRHKDEVLKMISDA